MRPPIDHDSGACVGRDDVAIVTGCSADCDVEGIEFNLDARTSIPEWRGSIGVRADQIAQDLHV